MQLQPRGAAAPEQILGQLPRAGAAKGQIGPNAVTRLAEALIASVGDAGCRAVFQLAGLEHHLRAPPAQMVDDEDVARLHAALHERLGPAAAGEIALEAGRLTGDYLLAHRIPQLAQRTLRLMPRALAARVLVKAIAGHAWTFAGSGAFSYELKGGALWMRLRGAPVCRRLKTESPACHYYVGTFARVFSAMLGPAVRVVETQCEASGAALCEFRLTWTAGAGS